MPYTHHCQRCAIAPICFTTGLAEAELAQIADNIEDHKGLRKGEYLFKNGDAFNGVYVVRSGSFKSFNISNNGKERIHQFYLPGELLGFDADNDKSHQHNCMALETSSVCKLSLDELFELASKIKSLQQQLFKLMSREIAQTNSIDLNTTAEEKIAKFLINLSDRYHRRGASATKFTLSMTREEIGEYLGLAAETVTRILKQLQKDNVITVNNRDINIMAMAKLKDIEQG